MQKFLMISFIVMFMTSSYAENIHLNSTDEIQPLSKFLVSLDPLQFNKLYSIDCQLYNSSANAVDMRFSVENYSHSTFTYFYLNETKLDSGIGQLKKGNNLVNITISTKRKGNLLGFYNLDKNYKVIVKDCTAVF